MEMVKKVVLQQHIEGTKRKLVAIRDNPEYDNGICEDIRCRIAKLYDELKVRKKSIDILKGRLTSQITSFKETIAKVLDKDTSLAKQITTLFWEQGITIASILIAIRMVIGGLVEALLPGETACTAGKPLPQDEKGAKEQLGNKLKALASLSGRLGMEAVEVLPGIIGGIISWILNRAAEVVGWVSQNLWALVLGVGGLLYM